MAANNMSNFVALDVRHKSRQQREPATRLEFKNSKIGHYSTENQDSSSRRYRF